MNFHETPFQKIEVLDLDKESKIVNWGVGEILRDSEYSHYSVLLFKREDKNDLILACSSGGEIIIWDSISYELIAEITVEGKSSMYHIIQWDETTFLVNNERSILSYSIISPFKRVKIFPNIDSVRLLKLNEEIFLSRKHSILTTINYDTKEIIRTFSVGHISMGYTMFSLFLSQKYLNCVYVNTTNEKNSVKLFDFQNYEIVKVFEEHYNVPEFKNDRGMFVSSTIFQNSKNQEMLILFASKSRFYLYNTSYPQFNTKIKIGAITEDIHGRGTENIFSSVCISDQYLVLGGSRGGVYFYEIEDERIRFLKSERIHRNKVWDVQVIKKENYNLRILSSGIKVKVLKIRGVVFKSTNKYEEMDFQERMEFLFLENQKFLFHSFEEAYIYVSIRTRYSRINDVFRSLLFSECTSNKIITQKMKEKEFSFQIDRPIFGGGLVRKRGDDSSECLDEENPLKKRKIDFSGDVL